MFDRVGAGIACVHTAGGWLILKSGLLRRSCGLSSANVYGTYLQTQAICKRSPLKSSLGEDCLHVPESSFKRCFQPQVLPAVYSHKQSLKEISLEIKLCWGVVGAYSRR